MNKQQSGFTLIELVIVIVILGILAATAAPKFIDLQGDAKASVIKGVEGSIQSAVSIAHSKALIAGQTGATGEIKIGNKYYALVNGYPAAQSVGTKKDGSTGNGLGISGLVELGSSGDVLVTEGAPTTFQHAKATTLANCQVSYTDATDANTPPSVVSDTSGC